MKITISDQRNLIVARMDLIIRIAHQVKAILSTKQTLLLTLLIFSLTGCGPYSISVNEKEVYTPPPLFIHFTMADAALKNCLIQTITDNHITTPAELKLLSCTKAGIKSIKGLEIFEGIIQLNLSDNSISSTAQLYQLSQLEVLLLENNQLTDIQSLLTLPKIKELNLAGNPMILCSDIDQLKKRSIDTLMLPQECRAI